MKDCDHYHTCKACGDLRRKALEEQSKKHKWEFGEERIVGDKIRRIESCNCGCLGVMVQEMDIEEALEK